MESPKNIIQYALKLFPYYFSALVGLCFVSSTCLTKISVSGRIALKQTTYWYFWQEIFQEKVCFPNWDPTWNRPAAIREL